MNGSVVGVVAVRYASTSAIVMIVSNENTLRVPNVWDPPSGMLFGYSAEESRE